MQAIKAVKAITSTESHRVTLIHIAHLAAWKMLVQISKGPVDEWKSFLIAWEWRWSNLHTDADTGSRSAKRVLSLYYLMRAAAVL